LFKDAFYLHGGKLIGHVQESGQIVVNVFKDEKEVSLEGFPRIGDFIFYLMILCRRIVAI
jgi:hypothetical protein